MSGMAYKISFTALLYIAVVHSLEDNQSSSNPILKSTSEAGLLPTVKYFSTPPSQYAASTPFQQGNIIIYGQPPLQPATYILQQPSTVQQTQIPQLSLAIQQPAPVLHQAAPIFQQAARKLQPAPVLQYAIRIAVPQPLLVEPNLIQSDGVPQTLQYIRTEPQQDLSPATPQLVPVTFQPQKGIQDAEEYDRNILKYNEAVPVQVKPQGVAQTLQYSRIAPQLQQEQVVSHLSPALAQPVQVTSQPQQGIQYAEEDDRNILKYNGAVPIQVKPEGAAQKLQYNRIVHQLQQEQIVNHLSPASAQPVQVASQQQQGIQYAEKDDRNILKYYKAVPIQVKSEGAAQTLQYNQLQQKQVVSHLSPASAQSVQVVSQQQQGIQYAEEDDKNVVKYNEVVTAVPIQVKSGGVAKKLQYFRIIPQLHSSPASAQPVQVASQQQQGIQYAEDDKNVKYNEVVAAAPVKVRSEDFDDNPQYTYGYNIEDISTGDSKQQNEQRIGNIVRGSYSVVDPDGYRRTVEYTVDANGFSAMVKRKPVQKGVAESKV